jgi:hypothetical protein
MARIIRWVGHPSPLDDHNIRRRIAREALDPKLVLAFSKFEHNRRVSVRKGATFTLTRQQGFSRDYQWGPQYYDVEMEEADWQRLAKHPVDRYMMLDVTNGVPPFRPLLTPAEWESLMRSVANTPAPQTFLGMG